MSCWCGHGPWHHHGYPYPPQAYYPPPYYGPPPPPPARRSRRRAADVEELTDYLQNLEEEIASVRRDLDEIRGSDDAERSTPPSPHQR